MRSVTIRMKIVGLVALFACGLATVLAMVYSKTSEKLEGSDYRDVVAMKDLIADVLPPPLYAIEALTVALQATQAMDKSSVAETRARWKQLEADFAARQRYWTEQQLHGPLRLSLLDNASPIGRKVFDIGNEQLLPAIAADDRVKAQAALVAITQAYNQHRAHIDEVVKQANQQVDVSIVAASSAIVTRKVEFMAVGLLVLLAGGFVAFLVVRDVAHRMQTTSDLLDRVSKGDLTQRVSVDSTDEIGRMAASLNNTLDAIENALAEVQQVSETVAEAADRLSGQSEQISTGAQQQASSLEETAASLEQITATVKQSSGSAQQASQLAMSSREVAQNGGLVVQEAVGAMTEITRASQRIGDIITTIDEIALQTNLLALNAAVEAARAGEQGRGFAVVASEVGSLAQRSAGAAKEVKTLIQDTLGRVNTGQKLVDQSGRTLQDIIVSVKKVTDIVGDIAAAAREQSAGVEQVNQAVSQMDQVTQSNAGQTEELARTADGLSQNAAQLRALVSNFRLGAGGRKDARPSRPAPRNDARRPSARPAARNGARRGARAETASERRGPAFDAGSDEWELAGSSGASSHDRQAEAGDQGSDDKHFESV